MPSIDNMLSYAVADATNASIGYINSVHHDERTGKPEWITVELGIMDEAIRFVPAMGLVLDHDLRAVVTPYDKAHIESAPDFGVGHALAADEEQALFDHYGLTYATIVHDEGLATLPADASAAS